MKGDVVCLFEYSGLSADAWARNGYHVYCYDMAHAVARTEPCGTGLKTFVPWTAGPAASYDWIVDRHLCSTVFLMSFPPCDDLAVSGARHFETKRARNAHFQTEAVGRAILSADAACKLSVPYVIENPVSVLATLWRPADHILHPYEYGGYLPVDDVHPTWPEYIAPRDAYPKKTCFWTGNGFITPPKKPVAVPPGYSTQYKKLGGKSAKTKQIRSASPRGVFQAVYEYNAG